MLGLTAEKLLVIAVFAAIILGPRRLPLVAQTVADMVRGLRRSVERAREHTEAEIGEALPAADWRSLDLRRYDPRQIVRDALQGPGEVGEARVAASHDAGPGEVLAQIASLGSPSVTGRGDRYRVSGSAAHPRRALLAPDPSSSAAVETRDVGGPEGGGEMVSQGDERPARQIAETGSG